MNKTYGGLVSQPRNSRGTTVIGTGVTHTFSGEVVETITIPEEYVIHDVIAPEGDVQVFKDQLCTEYATGAEQTVYVRLNTAVGFGEGFTVGDGSVQGDCFNVLAPSEGHEDDPYYVQVWNLWGSDDFAEAFTEGQVVKCVNSNPAFEPVENPTTVFSKPEPPTPVGPTAIDLGLPSGTLWADMNVGATAPEEAGDYFSWGNTEGHAEGSGYNFVSSIYDGTAATNISANLSLSQDAARANMGGNWRMPTKEETKELYDNTDSEWTTLNGVDGRKFMKKSDHSVFIFLPAAGYYSGTSLSNRGSYGRYWSASFLDSSNAYYLYFDSSNVNPQSSRGRYYGFSVRAVQNTSV